MNVNSHSYELVASSTFTKRPLPNVKSDREERHRFTRNSRKTARSRYWSFQPIKRFRGRGDWRFGLFAGLYASFIVLAANLACLLYGALTHGGVKNGVATITQGDMKTVSYMSTAMHVLINVLSTILLTSSNYAMQVLCAPTRNEIDRAHGKRLWMEIGLMSLRNLSNIDKRRRILWWLLAISSAPLHLFYNSAVFQVTSGQDYSITALQGSDGRPGTDWKRLSNSDWTRTYKDEYVSGYGDLALVMNYSSSGVVTQNDWSFYFNSSSSDSCDWVAAQNMEDIDIPAELNVQTKSLKPSRRGKYRVIYPIDSGGAFNFSTRDQWPRFDDVQVPNRYYDMVTLCTRSDKTIWTIKPHNASLRVEYAYAKELPFGSMVQIGFPFLIIVIVANSVKVACIFCTIRTCSSGHIVTVGDAVATFLENPYPITKGRCLQTQTQLLKANEETQSCPWQLTSKRVGSIFGGKRFNIMILVCSVVLTMCSLMLSLLYGFQGNWGTSSKLTLESTQFDFNARGTILTAFLANVPQVLLSVFYFSVNRICTSICFALEWNQYATIRKGLRVTSPEGDQRPTYFLQLPTKFAAPLVICSGVLHWLLSQSVFLVRLEARTRDGKIYPSSLCVCGYSVLSYLTFAMVLLTLITLIIVFLIIQVDVRIPPSRHCSFSISAACHPPSDDANGHLRTVRWDVLNEGDGSEAGHCTFTTYDVTKPVEDRLYA